MIRATALLTLALVFATGCSASRSLVVHSQPDSEQKMLGSGRQQIAAYITRDGTRVPFVGYVETVGETLRFVRPRIESRGLENPKPRIVRNVPRDSVLAVEALFPDAPRTILFVVGLAGLFAAFVLVGFALSFKSEPLL